MVGKTISQYKVLKKLGQGGMGEVYKAEDTKLKRAVALKFLPREFSRDKNAKARFLHEAQAASKFDHPNICTVHEIAKTYDGQLFIAMAYHEGDTLKEKIARGPLNIDEAIEIAIQIAQGLSKAHEQGTFHRDIKPANIMVTKDGIVKILDFGLAKMADARITKTGTTMGTAVYLSPEQASGEAVDHHTDIWSLGVVLYEMLTGQLPFKGEVEQAVIYAILTKEPASITSLHPDIPIELQQIITKALAKAPAERYQHVDEMLEDLRTILERYTPGKLKARSFMAGTLGRSPLKRKKRALHYGVVATLVILIIVGGSFLFIDNRKELDSIAVLPLENLSGDPAQEYFSDGMTEALITDLAQIGALRVISRTSVMQYKGTSKPLAQIAQDLNVDAVMTGSVLRDKDRVRITAQLIEVSIDRHVWAKSYERDLQDILSLQSEITRAIVDEIRVKLTPEEEARLASAHPVNPEAHEAYLMGRYFWNKRKEQSLKKAIEYFEQAIDMDPTYALAYTGLADAYNSVGALSLLHPKEAFPKAKAAAMKALEIDDSHGEAHAALAWVAFMFEWDWTNAEREFKRALELNPKYSSAHQWYAEFLGAMGRHTESLSEIKRAQELDPLSLIINTMAGWLYFVARQDDQAREKYLKTIAMDPNFALTHLFLFWIHVKKSANHEAVSEFEKFLTIGGESTENVQALRKAYARSDMTGFWRWWLKDAEEKARERYGTPVYFATAYMPLGELDLTFEYLNRAYDEKSVLLVWLATDPFWDPLRSDPRFQKLLKKMGLEE